MSKGSSIIRNLSNKISSRTLQVTVVPTPIKFSERRAVLHALQKYTPIEVFRKLDKHEASFISVTRHRSGAEYLVKKSPFQYQLAPEENTSSVRTFLTTTPSSDPILEQEATGAEDESEAQHLGPAGKKKQFTVHIFPAAEYVHSAAIRASPLHGPWPDGRRDTAMFCSLKRSLPSDIASDGLSDWESGGQSVDMARSKMVEDLLFGSKSLDVEKRAIAERLLRQKRKKSMPAVMDGLLHLQESAAQDQQQSLLGSPKTDTLGT
ncbi:hypothetical protein SODALDRAFT_322831 [Sodiomyces alkalinus F11]|uniref:Uncharacterized protein n=1 Tax=Sodiomyces alkalinus (strain CBS 110278 / VKM F-3762 / F11) TaxID=1314773 RepID=A0A3N2Q4Q9_SODAK|nr:hypothetical protein SODALDRAFT_322831 [Sodiomyces alkalinus F11]ROT41760.1 hypothetical protein SODALDRAFT_322831 [Sodiomyces alkalinus F11]